jgi:hypothetical protein
MTKDPENPTLCETEEDCAWAAWQAAFDGGKLLPDHDKFVRWWNSYMPSTAQRSLREKMLAAWNQGTFDRREQAHEGFNSWWQQILDSQPSP